MFLSDKKKAVFDQFGEEGLKQGVPQGKDHTEAWTQGYTFHGDAFKVFSDFFGGENPFSGKLLFIVASVVFMTLTMFVQQDETYQGTVAPAIFSCSLLQWTTMYRDLHAEVENYTSSKTRNIVVPEIYKH